MRGHDTRAWLEASGYIVTASNPPKGTTMPDTTNMRDFTKTLGSMADSALIRLGGAADLLLQADAAFKAGDDEKGKRYVNNAAASLGDTSIQLAVDASYPRDGEQISGA